jgi:hypothetical protein
MYKATRELIKERHKHSEYVLEVVNVDRRPMMTMGRCMRNSSEYAEGNDDLTLVSGWLVYPYNELTNSTEIVQHWWNFSISESQHFDVTIGNFDDCEYVFDIALYEYASHNHDAIASTVGKSLLLRDGKFQAVEEISGELKYSEIVSLETKNIFRHY